ncbi:MAG TPA: putative toxin-antitoxin system toxin component, PIN family [Bryobacteraceae bacterium]|nr:putative toxin-antitoxin system toxin component, PIN family [Bryobacteraceae bacterium]
MIVVLDSNVWISALEFGGTPELALTQALTVDQLAISDFIEREVVRVLTGKFHRESGALQVVLEDLLRWTYRVQIQNTLSGICRDPNDDPVLETAVAAKADLLVAGDRDLLSLKSFQGIGIVTPVDYLRIGLPA